MLLAVERKVARMAQVARYHPALVALHWLLALLIISELAFGFFGLAPMPNTSPDKVDILRVHMISGVTILALMTVRFVIRLATAKPPEATTGSPALDKLQRVSHYGFYLLVLLMVGSGFGTAFAAGLPAIVFGHSGDPLPADFDRFAPFKAHETIAALITSFLAVHVVAALYHQYGRKDGLFRRMWFGRRAT